MKGAAVLVVDDEEGNRAFFARVLISLGHSAVSVPSAEDAFDVLAGRDFDLILVDIVLPGASGLEAIGKFRALSGAHVYVMTGAGDPELERDVRLLGGSGYLPKPVDIDRLDAVLRGLRDSPPPPPK
jgi:CheY-like chemotaxis protein